MTSKKKILIAAGGTGGHLLPAQQLGELLKEKADIVFAGHLLGKSPFFEKGQYRFFDVPASPLGWSFLKGLIPGLWKSMRLLWRERPDVVIGFGSFHTVPILVASVLFRKKIVLYEANCSLGKVNRLFAPFATTLAAQFPLLGKSSATLVPLFPWVRKPAITKTEARKAYGLDPDRLTILIFGGSQGAKVLNEMVPKALFGMDVQILHFGMEKHEYSQKAIVKPFEKNMALAYAAADFVIGRSGAGTVSELITYKVPSLLIPYPFAYGHQQHNAEYLEKLGGSKMLLQSEASPEKIRDLIENCDRDAMVLALRNAGEQNRVAFEDIL